MKTKVLSFLVVFVILAATFSTSLADTNQSYLVLANSNSLSARLLAQLEAAGGTLERTIPEIGVAIVSGDSSFAASAQKLPGVLSVLPDYVIQWQEPVETFELSTEGINPPDSSEDDPFFNLLWGMDAIDVPETWMAGYRGAGVRVAVLDSGIDADQPDLVPNLNAALSASFVPGEDWWVRPGNFFNHGTHVAGTIAAADNGFGVIGVAPEAELVAVKVLSEYTGSGSFSGVLEGIVYAANIDADIINMSLGAYFDFSTFGSESAQLLVAFNRATNYATQQGTLIIASAGNNGADRDHDADAIVLPADAANVVTISATSPLGWAKDPANTFLDTPTYYTNYGQSSIDFAAPGGSVEFSAYPGGLDNCTVAGLTRPCYVFDLVFSNGTGNPGNPYSFYWAQGTSMAAPHAAGVAALIIGANGGEMNPAHVLSALRAGADDLGKPGHDDFYGGGRVNALAYFD